MSIERTLKGFIRTRVMGSRVRYLCTPHPWEKMIDLEIPKIYICNCNRLNPLIITVCQHHEKI